MAGIKVTIGASIDGIKRSFNSLKNMAKSTGQSIKSSLGGMGAKIGAMLSIGATIAVVKNVSANLDNLKKSADNLNMNTDEFQRFSHGARLAGMSAKEFEMGAVKSLGMLADALDGNQGAIDKFAQMNIDPEMLRGKDSAAQLDMILEGLNGVEDQTKKNQLATDLFGKSGKRVLGFAKVFKNLKQDADGTLISEEDLKAAEDYNDAMLRLQQTFSKMVIESGLIQFLTRVGVLLENIYSKNPDKNNAIVKAAAKKANMMDMAKNAIFQDMKKGKVDLVNEDDVGKAGADLWKPTRFNNADAEYWKSKISDKKAIDWLNKKYPDWEDTEAKRRKADEETAAKKKITDEQKTKAAEIKTLNETRARIGEKLGNVSESEQSQLDKAQNIKEIFALEKQITEQRKEQLKIDEVDKSIQDEIKGYEQEFKWQQMLLKGLEKEVEIEKKLDDLRKKAKRDLTDAEKADATSAVSKLFELSQQNKDKELFQNPVNPRMEFKGDSVLAMGGLIGNQAKLDSGRDVILKAQAKSLVSLERSVTSLDNKVASKIEQTKPRWI